MNEREKIGLILAEFRKALENIKVIIETYVLISMMVIVGQVSSEQEALEIQSIAKINIVAQRARFLARQKEKVSC